MHMYDVFDPLCVWPAYSITSVTDNKLQLFNLFSVIHSVIILFNLNSAFSLLQSRTRTNPLLILLPIDCSLVTVTTSAAAFGVLVY